MSEEPATVSGPPKSLPAGIVKALRPRQWVKNVLVLAAPIAAGTATEADVLLPVALAFVVFCMAASGIYLVNDAIYHPGDSYVVPTVPVEVALIPLHAPWAKMAEAMDFAVSLRAPRALGIHDSLLAPPGLAMYRERVASIGGEHGTEFSPLEPGESLQL